MVSILSWDVGIKNLAYCILESKEPDIKEEKEGLATRHGFFIKDWGLINLYPEEEPIIHYCQGVCKNKKKCEKKAKYVHTNEEKKNDYYCKLHSPKGSTLIKKIKKKNKNHRPYELSQRIYNALKDKKQFQEVDYVLVEQQPNTLNPIMKSVQRILFTTLSMLAFTTQNSKVKRVNDVHARQKEKIITTDTDWPQSEEETKCVARCRNIKGNYSKRKIRCLYYTKFCLRNTPEYLNFLSNHSKQDDLSDCFLQGCAWLLKHYPCPSQ